MQRARVVVLGSEAKEKLFSGRTALHERVRIDGLSFEVIGVLAPKMQAGMTISTVSALFPSPPWVI